jgi:hypothetical protein
MYSLSPALGWRWKGVGRKPCDSRALTVITIWQEIGEKHEGAYTASLEMDRKRFSMLCLSMRLAEQPYIELRKG